MKIDNKEDLKELSNDELYKEFRQVKWNSVEYKMIIHEIVRRKGD